MGIASRVRVPVKNRFAVNGRVFVLCGEGSRPGVPVEPPVGVHGYFNVTLRGVRLYDVDGEWVGVICRDTNTFLVAGLFGRHHSEFVGDEAGEWLEEWLGLPEEQVVQGRQAKRVLGELGLL